MSLELILPFLRPLEPLLRDATITEIMVNGPHAVFIERDGALAPVPDTRLDERSLRVAVQNIARALGHDISEAEPVLDARLPDGSRVAAAIPPVSIGGTTLTIRKFGARLFTAEELIDRGMLTADQLATIEDVLARRQNVLISGGTGTGKTTLLNVLAQRMPAGERLVVIEETAELRLDRPNVVRFEAQRAQPDRPAVTIRDLVRAALRHRPDRLIVGEVRGAEAFDLLQALNTGHGGSITTIHASSAEHACLRLRDCVLAAASGLSEASIAATAARAICLIAQTERVGASRRVVDLRAGAGSWNGRD